MQYLRFWGSFLVLLIASPALAADGSFFEGLRSCPKPAAAGQEHHAVWGRNPLILNDVARGLAFRGLLGLAQIDALGTPEVYVTFDTGNGDASLPDWVRAAHPGEITIVLQYEFADLIVGPNYFDVGIWFGGKPAHLHVPFSAITLFLDARMSFCYVALPSGGGSPSSPPP